MLCAQQANGQIKGPKLKRGFSMKVEQLMTRNIEACKARETLNRAAQIMWERDCGFIPVIASNGDGALIGVITDRDIAMATYIQGKPPLAIALSSVMTRGPV